MHSRKEVIDKTNSKDKSKMEIENTQKKASDYLMYVLVIAVVIQLLLLVYRLTQL